MIRRTSLTKGYPSLTLATDGVRRTSYVHDLVAAAFIGPKPLGLQVNHKDGNPQNNHVTNLEYVTRSENMLHWARTLGNKIGETHHSVILTEIQVRRIRREYRPYVFGYTELGRKYGVSRMTVYDIVKRRTWTHI